MIVSSDGVGDGQLQFVEHYEIPQIKTACHAVRADYNPQVTYVVVQKRINSKLMKVNYNFLSNSLLISLGSLISSLEISNNLIKLFLSEIWQRIEQPWSWIGG